ncbi:MAG: PilZ domain-containing protein [Burkholderiaceae bacterium]
MIDKRAHFRKSLEADAWLADVLGNTWTPVRLMDISIGGAAMILEEELHAGATRMLRFSLPGSTERLIFTARIAHCTKHTFLAGYRVGVEFIRRDAHAVAAIEQFIKDSTQ